MSYATFTLLAVLAFIVYNWWRTYNRSKGLPPGPSGLPILGYMPHLKKDPHLVLTKLGKQYGGIFTIDIGTTPYVVITDWKIMKEAYIKQSEVFSGRPENFAVDQLVNRADLGSSDGPKWKEHRRFTLHHLRNFGIGKTSLESIIGEKAEELVQHLDENLNSKLEMSKLAFLPVLSIIWTISAGKSFKSTDKYMLKFGAILTKTMELFASGSLVNVFPWTRFLPGSSFGEHMSNHKVLSEFLNKEIKEHYDTYSEGEPRDLIDVFIAEILKTSDEAKARGPFNDEHLFGTIYDMFFGGSETVTTTMGWALLYIAVWPEIQSKVQEELDTVIGKNRRPVYSDRTHLPYTEAVLMEIQRFASIAGMGNPHCPMQDAQLMGYRIPKGTNVLGIIYAVHFDPLLWGDPEVFRPERFLDSAGKTVKPEYFIPFSLGSRFCLGEPLARMELFMFFTCLLQRFNFRCLTGVAPPSLKPNFGGTLQPYQYNLRIERR